MTNKSVEYFGFPKSDEYSRKWCIAAGREDLLDKPLLNICKYYLCASHFTDDCFTDSTRMYLRKTSRPVIVPVPTIFKNNLGEFINRKKEDEPHTLYYTSKMESNNKRLLSEDEQNEFEEAPKKAAKNIHIYTLPETQIDGSNSDTIFDDTEVQLKGVEEVTEELLSQCRLCAVVFGDSDNCMIPIFNNYDNNDDTVREYIERLLPDTIFPDDGKPQNICFDCYEKVTQCINTIDSFYIAQTEFD